MNILLLKKYLKTDQMDFYPAGRGGDILSVIFGTPAFHERHSEKEN